MSPPPDATPDRPGSDTGPVVAAVLLALFTVVVTVNLAGAGWLFDELLPMYGGGRPWWLWPALNLAGAALVGVPALLLTLMTRNGRRTPARGAAHAAGRAWLAGATALAAIGAVRAVPARESEWYLAGVAGVAVVLALLWQLGGGRSRGRPGRRTGRRTGLRAGAFATAAGAVLLLPWLLVGALGGVPETVLAVLAAGAVGWLAATVLDHRFWRWFDAGRARLVPLGGTVAGVALLPLAVATGGSGAHLASMVVLPPLGWLAAALVPVGRPVPRVAADHTPTTPGPAEPAPAAPRWPLAVLVALAAAGPLALVDPEEITLLLLDRDVPFWTVLATVASSGLALLLGVVALFGLTAPATRRPGPPAGPVPARRWRRWVAVTAALAAVLTAAGGYVAVGQPGFHGDRLFVVLAEQADLTGLPTGTGQVGRDARVVEVHQRLVTHARDSQAALRADLERWGVPYTPYYLVNAIEVEAGPVVRELLADRPEVDRVLPSQRLRPLPVDPPTARGRVPVTDDPEWNIRLIGADRVWREHGVTGEGVVVGSSDSGVDGGHPALAPGFRGGGDSWRDPWRHTTSPTDRSGHGTHTVGSAVGRDGIGVAPGAQWVGCVNLNRNLGNPARYLDCLQFMLAPYPPDGDPWRDGHPRRAPHVLTNSWGCPPIEGCDRAVLRPAAAALAAAGVFTVAAAGNAGPVCGSVRDPLAPYPEVFTVGATGTDGEVSVFSSRGPVAGTDKPDLVAPGDGVLSAMPGGGYARLSGTSMAAPHVAGVVALLWSADPELIGDLPTTAELLRDTAAPVPAEPGCGDASAHAGAGLVDAYAAVSAALAGDGPAGAD